MTREETINILNEWVGIGQLGESCSLHFEADLDDVDDALEMAISALREQEERSKGCDFCNADYAVMSGSYMTLDFQHKSITPKFCPKCGRRLEEV